MGGGGVSGANPAWPEGLGGFEPGTSGIRCTVAYDPEFVRQFSKEKI
jgi:hypothetical protein